MLILFSFLVKGDGIKKVTKTNKSLLFAEICLF